MRFPGICLVEQTEQKFRRFESILKKKTKDCNSRALLLTKAPTKIIATLLLKMENSSPKLSETFVSFNKSFLEFNIVDIKKLFHISTIHIKISFLQKFSHLISFIRRLVYWRLSVKINSQKQQSLSQNINFME